MNRAKIIWTAALAVAFVPAVASAISLSGYGLRTGVASSAIHSKRLDFAPDSRTGFAGSLFCRIPISGHLSIQPEVSWAAKGGAGDQTVYYPYVSGGAIVLGSIDYPFQQRVDYLEIPILLRVAPRVAFFEPYAVAGPGVAIRTGQKTTSVYRRDETLYYPRVQPARIFEGVGTFDHPNYRTVDFSATTGVGLAIGRGSWRVVLDTRYALGLLGTLETVGWTDAHSSSWITTLGIERR